MRRRDVLAGLAAAGLVVRPASTLAQPGLRRVGYLSYGSGGGTEPDDFANFEARLVELGWVIGMTLVVDYRLPAGDASRGPGLARELLALDPDVLVAVGTPQTAALKAETSTVPIVFWANTDPVGSGLVASLAEPGGNVTGFQGFEYSLAGKWIDLLLQAAPRTGTMGFMYNPLTIPFYRNYVDVAASTAAGLNLGFVDMPITDPAEIEPMITALASRGNAGLVVPPDSFTANNVSAMIEAPIRNRLPAIYTFDYFPPAGGLMSYNYDRRTLVRQAAEYVDRLLRGADPHALPVQAPAKYNLVINLRTAAAIGLEMPASLLVTADQIIE